MGGVYFTQKRAADRTWPSSGSRARRSTDVGLGWQTDVVKSRLQVDSLRRPQYRGTWDCFQQARWLTGLPCMRKRMLTCCVDVLHGQPVPASDL